MARTSRSAKLTNSLREKYSSPMFFLHDRHRAVGGHGLVVHAVIQAQRVGHEAHGAGTARGDGIEQGDVDVRVGVEQQERRRRWPAPRRGRPVTDARARRGPPRPAVPWSAGGPTRPSARCSTGRPGISLPHAPGPRGRRARRCPDPVDRPRFGPDERPNGRRKPAPAGCRRRPVSSFPRAGGFRAGLRKRRAAGHTAAPARRR